MTATVLALSFSGPLGTAALIDGARQHEAVLDRNADGGTPGRIVQRVLEESGGFPTLLAVALGPGSYTGIRMAVSFAKALAQVRNLPLYAWSDHALLAALHAQPGECVTVLHGGHGQRVYTSRWRGGALMPEQLGPERLLPRAEISIEGRCLGDRSESAEGSTPWVSALQIAQLAQRASAAGVAPPPLAAIEPVLPA